MEQEGVKRRIGYVTEDSQTMEFDTGEELEWEERLGSYEL